jgi:catalase
MVIETSSLDSSRQIGASPLVIATASAAATVLPPPVVETPSSMVSTLHSAFGQHHCRAVHAKGTILEGSFTPTTQAKDLSQAMVFSGGAVPITVQTRSARRQPGLRCVRRRTLFHSPRGSKQ